MAAFTPFPDAAAGFLLAHVGGGGRASLSLATADLGGTLGYTCPSGASSGANVTFRRLGPLGHEAKKIVALEGMPTITPFYAVIMARGEAGTALEEAEEEALPGLVENTPKVEDEEEEEEEEKGQSKASTTTTQTIDLRLIKTGT